MPYSTVSARGVRVLSALAILLVTASARAASVSWDGPAIGGVWTTPANWSNDAVPTASDEVTISGAAVGIGDARTIAGLTLSNDARLQVSGIGASLAVTGPANIDNGLLVATEFG